MKVRTMLKLAVCCVALFALALFVWNAVTTFHEEYFDVDANIPTALVDDDDLPQHRCFHMGFTYQPFDWSEDAFVQTFEYIRKHGDLITLFHDVGIPWPEALAGEPYHKEFEKELQRQMRGASQHEQVVVMVSCLAPDRVSLAPYASENTAEPRPEVWADRTFDDPEVVAAYLDFARDMIGRFKPKYYGYVAEVDSVFTDTNDERFQKLLSFSQQVYTTLKKEFPELVVFAEFNLGDDTYMKERQDVIDAMLPLTDLYAVSTYPALNDLVAGDASKLPHDWFSRVASIAPSKPFAVLETGFHAEHFMHPTLGVRIKGRNDRLLVPGGPKSQALYTLRLLEAAQQLNAVFVNQWAVRDLDLLFEKMEDGQAFADPMWRSAQDMGLYDEAGTPRPALCVWDSWTNLRFSPHAEN